MSSLETDPVVFIGAIWAGSKTARLFNGDRSAQLGHDVYCEYYQYQWRLFSGHANSCYTATRRPENTLRLVQNVYNGKTRAELRMLLKSTVPNATDEACDNSIDLAARLVAMMKIGVPKDQLVPQGCLRWEKGCVRDFVNDFFGEVPKLNHGRIRLPKTFDAWSIHKIAGITIAFTDNLADHLLLTDDDTKLLIFHHTSFLECHLNPSTTAPPLYPPGLVNETLRTIALLFPQSEFTPTKSKKSGRKSSWLHKLRLLHDQSGHYPTPLDRRLSLCGTLQAQDRQIERFYYWRDRLVILKQTYDDATPSSLKQWWYDRRNGVQWYTFWVAVLVLLVTTVLSVLQTLAAGLQVYKAYVPTLETPSAGAVS